MVPVVHTHRDYLPGVFLYAGQRCLSMLSTGAQEDPLEGVRPMSPRAAFFYGPGADEDCNRRVWLLAANEVVATFFLAGLGCAVHNFRGAGSNAGWLPHPGDQKGRQGRMKNVVLGFFLMLVFGLGCPTGGSAATLEEMVGQMLMIGFRGTSFDVESPLGEALKQGNLGGVILYDVDVARGGVPRNIRSVEQVRALTSALQEHAARPLLIAVDEEGGNVSRLAPRLGLEKTDSAAALGRKDAPALTRRAGRRIGRQLRHVGINWDFAPVVDLNRNPSSPAIGKLDRSFGPTTKKVTRHAAAFIHGLHDVGVLSCIKHFPGHGSATADSHLGVTDITDTWSATELEPYARLVGRELPDAVMTGHVFHAGLDPEAPATLSNTIIPELLRDAMGFEGVVVSDDLQMGAIREAYTLQETVRRCLHADVDILLFGNNLEYEPYIWRRVQTIISELVREGHVSRARIERSYERIQKLKTRLGVFTGTEP